MSQQFTISTSTSGVCLYHGTDIKSAAQIVEIGVNAEMARSFGGDGIFWASRNWEVAKWFALSNPAAEEPALLKIELSSGLFGKMITKSPVIVITHDETETYEFLPDGFSLMNSAITSVETVEFEE